ncbi:hypothetical protein [Shewanella xiamenensis]|uniref:Uncharacterized protein n=1 Tax=Shewanella xiamenensis TaxID=332186 RepID=A0AAE4TG40_9GAMM|nr:hypothetical protein [Shewanella xiamenensis]MDV5390731.1 hypothetical protein [Shewanella xiamenensis]
MAFETINLGTQPAGTGGDTARSAFEKTNRNFLAAEVLSAAMSQAQFEAIRAQNNEEFAASGFVHFGKHDSTSSRNPINQGLWTLETASNVLFMGRSYSPHSSSKSKSDAAIINFAGVLFELTNDSNVSNKQFGIKFPQAPDGKTTYNKSTGVITNHATVAAAFNAQAADPTNVEVVTDRVDMWGFEAWLEEVSTTNPYVYPNGLIQSQATTMDGIATSASARPVTYYAVFDGDTGSKGKGLNFFALTDAQKKKVLANPKNNLYYLDDGRLVQWRLRQRTVAGAGNGDWLWLDSTNSSALGYLSVSRLKPQGILNVAKPLASGNNDEYLSTGHSVNTKKFTGIYEGNVNTGGIAVNNECYFLVCGTVNRLNQGAYHPSFNHSGAAAWRNAGNNGTVSWHVIDSTYINSKLSCFDFALLANKPNPLSGAIGQTSGRPDGRYYDAIYADGQGGVCRDMRYSAYGVDAVDFAEADQKVKNGTYRGFEKLIFSKPIASGYWNSSQHSNKASKFLLNYNGDNIIYINCNAYGISIGDTITVYAPSANLLLSIVINKIASVDYASGLVTTSNIYSGSMSGNGSAISDIFIIHSKQSTLSVGGSFLQTDVIGNPADILVTPQLANGWQGSWIPVIPNGTNKEFMATRKSNAAPKFNATIYNGVTWTAGTFPSWNNVTNSSSYSEVSNAVIVLNYTAFAKQTENAINASVYGKQGMIGNISFSSIYLNMYGGLLAESLIGKVLKALGSGYVGNLPLITNPLLNDTGVMNISIVPTHQPLAGINTNNSPAFKALNYSVNLNQQAFIQYAYTELKHNGTNWGDDGKVTIVDNQSTKTDLNGNTVLVGTAKLKEPIGWIKNKV